MIVQELIDYLTNNFHPNAEVWIKSDKHNTSDRMSLDYVNIDFVECDNKELKVCMIGEIK
jgi:hypothetical protein